jgi:hypothetical protein
LAVVLVAGVLVAPLAACGASREEVLADRQEMVRQMLDHLQAKYGKPFKLYWSRWPDKMRYNVDTAFGVYPEGGMWQDYFLVKPDTSGKETVFHDGYVGILMRPTYEEKAQAILSRYFPGSILLAVSLGQDGTFPDDLDAAATFDQFKAHADQNYDVNFTLYVPVSDGLDEAAAKAMLPDLRSELSAVAGRGYLYVVACLPDVFEERIASRLRDDPVRRFEGVFVAGGYVQFEFNTRWGK